MMIPCKWCSRTTENIGTRECDHCWELRTRIEMTPELAQKIFQAVTGRLP